MIRVRFNTMRTVFKSFFLMIMIYPRFRRQIFTELKKVKIIPFKISSWHHGACYFLCKTEEKKYFVKTDLKFGLLQNELLCEQLFKKKYPKFNLLEICFIDSDYQYVAYEYVESPTIREFFNNSKYSEKAKLGVLSELITFLDVLYQMNIVYRDIKMDNFFVSAQESLMFFDFSFAISVDDSIGLKELVTSRENEKVLYYMGSASQCKRFCWDDALGMFNLLCELERLSGLDLSLFKEKTKVNVGRLVYKYEPVYL
jgi:serine/threonine protein kinase